MSLVGRSVDREDGLTEGEPRTLNVVVGICDVGDGVDDCAMRELCVAEGWYGCDLGRGIAYRDALEGHWLFTPWLPEGRVWWNDTNRYGSLHHEHTDLLDFTYTRPERRDGPDSLWWVEGLPQYIQSLVLAETVSWRRGDYDATLLDVFTYQDNASEYYEGMRVFAYLAERDPWTLEDGRRDEVRHLRGARPAPYWHDLLGPHGMAAPAGLGVVELRDARGARGFVGGF